VAVTFFLLIPVQRRHAKSAYLQTNCDACEPISQLLIKYGHLVIGLA